MYLDAMSLSTLKDVPYPLRNSLLSFQKCLRDNQSKYGIDRLA